MVALERVTISLGFSVNIEFFFDLWHFEMVGVLSHRRVRKVLIDVVFLDFRHLSARSFLLIVLPHGFAEGDGVRGAHISQVTKLFAHV